MPWIRKGPPNVHKCSPPPPLPHSRWYCDKCGRVYDCKWIDPRTWDMIRDQPMDAAWTWVHDGSRMVEG